MILVSLNWNTILENSISGLIGGIFIVVIGVIVWRKQHLYSKKLDAYNELIVYISYLNSFTQNNKPLSEVEYSELSKLMVSEVIPSLHRFDFYFEGVYIPTFIKLSDLILTKSEYNYFEEAKKQIKLFEWKFFKRIIKKANNIIHNTKVTPP
jgi:hypothetical protein